MPAKPGRFLGLGTPVLPALPMHGGDRNRTSPFAFTGNKFEFRALGSSQSPAMPNTVLNTIVAAAIDELSKDLEKALKTRGTTPEKARRQVVKNAWKRNKKVVFDGDNYYVAWHKEAAETGLPNLRTTPEALPYLVAKDTVAIFRKYKVLSKRELESRYEVFSEQYATLINIEAETAVSIARTMLLPAAVRYLAELHDSAVEELVDELEPLVEELRVEAAGA